MASLWSELELVPLGLRRGALVFHHISFFFIQQIFNFLLSPTRKVLPPGVKIIYTQPGEAFGMYITVSMIAGAIIASPYVMYQVWMFIAPGLYSKEKRMAIPFVLFTTIGFQNRLNPNRVSSSVWLESVEFQTTPTSAAVVGSVTELKKSTGWFGATISPLLAGADW